VVARRQRPRDRARGCALGARFERSFLRRAPRLVAAVVISIGAAMALSAVFGVAVAAATGLHPATLAR
jgi:uncharacterized membrane protein AbrB (regulator of aidB expression)